MNRTWRETADAAVGIVRGYIDVSAFLRVRSQDHPRGRRDGGEHADADGGAMTCAEHDRTDAFGLATEF